MQSRRPDPNDHLGDIQILMQGRDIWTDQNQKAISTFHYLGGDLDYLRKMVESAPFGKPRRAQGIFSVAVNTKIRPYKQFCRLFVAGQGFHKQDVFPSDIQKLILNYANKGEENSIDVQRLVSSVRSKRPS